MVQVRVLLMVILHGRQTVSLLSLPQGSELDADLVSIPPPLSRPAGGVGQEAIVLIDRWTMLKSKQISPLLHGREMPSASDRGASGCRHFSPQVLTPLSVRFMAI